MIKLSAYSTTHLLTSLTKPCSVLRPGQHNRLLGCWNEHLLEAVYFLPLIYISVEVVVEVMICNG